MPDDTQPKIIVDSDWKSQARAEKDRLAQQEASKKAERAPDEPIGMEDLIGWLATQALMYLGYFPDPQTGQAVVSLEYAKLYVDMLGVVETKTKGNLTEQESASLAKTLSQLRGAFVEVSRAVTKAVQEGRIRPMSAPAPAPAPGVAGSGAAPATPGPASPGIAMP